MKLDENEADFVAETLHLTKSESDQIRRFRRGEGLLIAHKDHVIADFLATPTEFKLCDTNRVTLAAQRDAIAYQKTKEDEAQTADDKSQDDE